MTLLAGAASVYSQGTVSINGYNGAGAVVQVFLTQPTANDNYTVTYGGYTVAEESGNTANSYSGFQGTTVYSNFKVAGTGYDVQAYAVSGTAAATGQTYSQLAAVGTVVTAWNTGPAPTSSPTNGAVGTWNTTQTPQIPGATTTASIAIAAWKNSGVSGAATTLAEAQADGYAWGFSPIASTTVATGVVFPGSIPSGITDFSITAPVPEPSTIALGVMGASAFLFRRRK